MAPRIAVGAERSRVAEFTNKKLLRKIFPFQSLARFLYLVCAKRRRFGLALCRNESVTKPDAWTQLIAGVTSECQRTIHTFTRLV